MMPRLWTGPSILECSRVEDINACVAFRTRFEVCGPIQTSTADERIRQEQPRGLSHELGSLSIRTTDHLPTEDGHLSHCGTRLGCRHRVR
ncbi:hypothetical protein L226DRAFT_97233 [Lentinus tigrinus ALCF2SS1-7]|uniref:uncharacterized protein n=1 Tax=Lentinus tigrinus ALCF2SS1-7 TaxID=1328758 RepID=UPI00116639CD|nr:hypothetical protein L226DRAFT_97233 [Lentinus tigrinus ALCF2SS1-7]